MKINMPMRTLSLAAVILALSSGCSEEQMDQQNAHKSAQPEVPFNDHSSKTPRHIGYLRDEEDPVLVRAAMTARILRLAKEANETNNGNSDQGRQFTGATAEGLKLTYSYQLESGTSITRALSEYSAADIASICENHTRRDDLARGAIYAFRYSNGKSQSEVQVAQGDCE